MQNSVYDVIVIGAGSGGLGVSLSMLKLGCRVLLVDKSDKKIGGECLNDGCVPSKALIHVSRMIHTARQSSDFGLEIAGKPDIEKVFKYVHERQEIIRKHENAAYLKAEGMNVVLGTASFVSKDEVEVNGQKYRGKKIVIATGSKPAKLTVPGVERVKYYDNENVFRLTALPAKILMIGAGPINIELGQALHRLGSEVTIVENSGKILSHDDEAVTDVLFERLKLEGIKFIMNARLESFSSPAIAVIKHKEGALLNVEFDALFVGIGRELDFAELKLANAGIETKDGKIVADARLQTTNKNVFLCGDIAGSLKFSHAAEQHTRLLVNNFFSPLKKKLNNDRMSWVTFSDPEVAAFGLSEKQLKDRNTRYRRLENDFSDDDRAVTDDYRYAKMVLFITKGIWFARQKILGGAMAAPNAGELIEELILANAQGLSINAIFNKIYPYPVAARINQQTIVNLKQEQLTPGLKKLLQLAFKIFS